MGKKRIDKKHSFNVIIAEKYTVQKALIIEEILNWCEYNKLKKQNFFSGKYWTRRTAKEYHKQFPYMNEKSIDRWLKELVEDGILYVGKFNKKKFDKTNWHCVNLLKYNQILYVPQNEESTPQNEVCVPQNEVCVPQNEETIPTPNINSLSKEYGECVNTQKHTPEKEPDEIERPTQDDPIITVTDQKEKRKKVAAKKEKFIPPTPEQIYEAMIEYEPKKIKNIQLYPNFQQMFDFGMLANEFHNHYTANDWKVGRNKMKDYTATCRNWVLNRFVKWIERQKSNASYDDANNEQKRYGIAPESVIRELITEFSQ